MKMWARYQSLYSHEHTDDHHNVPESNENTKVSQILKKLPHFITHCHLPLTFFKSIRFSLLPSNKTLQHPYKLNQLGFYSSQVQAYSLKLRTAPALITRVLRKRDYISTRKGNVAYLPEENEVRNHGFFVKAGKVSRTLSQAGKVSYRKQRNFVCDS